jgi:hypothetical protein
MQEGVFPFCRCETCRETKEMLGKEDLKVHKNSKVNLNGSVRHVEAGSRRSRSVDSCGRAQDRRSRKHNWGRSNRMHHSIQNSDRSVAFMNPFRASLQGREESGIIQEYVTEEIDYRNNGMYELNEIFSRGPYRLHATEIASGSLTD